MKRLVFIILLLTCTSTWANGADYNASRAAADRYLSEAGCYREKTDTVVCEGTPSEPNVRVVVHNEQRVDYYTNGKFLGTHDIKAFGTYVRLQHQMRKSRHVQPPAVVYQAPIIGQRNFSTQPRQWATVTACHRNTMAGFSVLATNPALAAQLQMQADEAYNRCVMQAMQMQQSRQYTGTCLYPSDIAADGSRCGNRAASVRPGGRY